jgi:hypothetical protein
MKADKNIQNLQNLLKQELEMNEKLTQELEEASHFKQLFGAKGDQVNVHVFENENN